MSEKLNDYSTLILPWLLTHGLQIVIISIVGLFLNALLSRIIARSVRIAIVADKNLPEDAEKSARTRL